MDACSAVADVRRPRSDLVSRHGAHTPIRVVHTPVS